ncbi:NADPH-dependent FMN reductase [Nocardia sp. NPDC057227]|uniref:NADPH-dependent FMN reductase n=1 Tax=Nocardia sp. NPDC057227 TaxID=3346056 RepID=UPI00362B955E
MSAEPLTLVIVVGSVRDGRFGPTAARWFATRAQAHGRFTVRSVDLLDHPLPLVMPEPDRAPAPEVAAVRDVLGAELAAADAFAVVTPEYNHSLPAALKNVIDWYFPEWAAKPVACVSYGGMSGGLRAIEHLRQIFAELHAVTVRESLSFHNPWDTFRGTEPDDAAAADIAAQAMLDRLAWWAETLRAGRLRRPFVR